MSRRAPTEFSPGDHVPLDSSAGFSRPSFCVAIESVDLSRPFRARKYFFLIQGRRAARLPLATIFRRFAAR